MNVFNGAVERCAPLLGNRRLPRVSFGNNLYSDIVQSIRTGDILLFNSGENNSLLYATPLTRARNKLARSMAECLSTIPCSTYAAARGENVDQSDDEDVSSGVLPFDLLQWQHAALIVCIQPKTLSASNGAKVESTSRPFVFMANANGVFDLRPLEDFLAKLAECGSSTFAVRHLLINNEVETDGETRHRASIRRVHLSDHIIAFQKGVYQQSLEPTAARFDRAVSRALVYEQNTATEPTRIASLSKRDLLALMRASVSFTSLYTLYSAQVLRVEPRAIDCTQLAQQQNDKVFRQQLAADYHYTNERLFSFR